MPLSIKKKNAVVELPPMVEEAMSEVATAGLDLSNRSNRSPVGWIPDGSPSMTGFTQLQLDRAQSMVQELRKIPSTARSVMMNIVQLGEPPATTGFHEIAQFQVPSLHQVNFTPLHTALAKMTQELGGLFSDLRTAGLERTESVVLITTDGYANGATPDELAKSIEAFLLLGKKWSVTNLVFGVGDSLNVELLKKLSNTIPPLQIAELNAELLIPFIQKIVRQVSESRRGQTIETQLPDGIEVIE